MKTKNVYIKYNEHDSLTFNRKINPNFLPEVVVTY